MKNQIRYFIREVIRQERFLDRPTTSYSSSKTPSDDEGTTIAKGVMSKVRDTSTIKSLFGKAGSSARSSKGVWGKAGARTKAVLGIAAVAAAVVAVASVGKEKAEEVTDQDQEAAGKKVDNFLSEINTILNNRKPEIRGEIRNTSILKIEKGEQGSPSEAEVPSLISSFDVNYKNHASKMNGLSYSRDSSRASTDFDSFFTSFTSYDSAKEEIKQKIEEFAAGDQLSNQTLTLLASRFLALHAREEIQSCMAVDYSVLSSAAKIREGSTNASKIEAIIEEVDRQMDNSNVIKTSEKAFQ